jgi:hypothetical protein
MRLASNKAVWLIAATALLIALCGCSGAGSSLPGADLARSPLSAPTLISVSAKSASGAPVGIWTSWTRVVSGLAQGYYLYRDTASIPDPPVGGSLDPTLRVNGGSMIAQPPTGATVTFNDIFAGIVGQTYYYRVTVVDDLDQESDPSNEVSWTLHGQNVGGLNPTSAYWGDSITISGDTFGTYAPASDFVRFPAIGGGEVDGIIEQAADWTATSIKVTVPANALTGKVKVVIDATIAESNNPLTVRNAWISAVAPNPGFLEQNVTLTGGNYGATRGVSTITLGGADISSAVVSWASAKIVVSPPASAVAGDFVVTVSGHASNAAPWIPLPEIQSADPVTLQSGEPLVLNGRLFEASQGQVLLDAVTPKSVSIWTADMIAVTVTGTVGPHTLVVETAGGLTSNELDITIVAPLAVTMNGLSPGTVYRPASPPAIGVATAADADSVDLVIDGSVVSTVSAPPFSGLVLPAATLTNGTHQVKLVAHRRAVSANSAQVDVVVYSLDGDIDGDGIVGLGDQTALIPLIGMTPASPGFWPWYDTDNDGAVTEADLSLVGYNFGNMLPPPLP